MLSSSAGQAGSAGVNAFWEQPSTREKQEVVGKYRGSLNPPGNTTGSHIPPSRPEVPTGAGLQSPRSDALSKARDIPCLPCPVSLP